MEKTVCIPDKRPRAINPVYICHEHFCAEVWASNVNKVYIGIANAGLIPAYSFLKNTRLNPSFIRYIFTLENTVCIHDTCLRAINSVNTFAINSYQLELGNKTSQIPKPLETLQSKQNYVCNYSVLMFYCKQGLLVTKLHKALKFNQSEFLKCYMEQNTKLQQQPSFSAFKKNFFKLLNNSCFGKTTENLRLRCRYKMLFVESEDKAKFYCNQYNFEKITIFRDNLVGITLNQKEIRWNKTNLLGCGYHGSIKITPVQVPLWRN